MLGHGEQGAEACKVCRSVRGWVVGESEMLYGSSRADLWGGWEGWLADLRTEGGEAPSSHEARRFKGYLLRNSSKPFREKECS